MLLQNREEDHIAEMSWKGQKALELFVQLSDAFIGSAGMIFLQSSNCKREKSNIKRVGGRIDLTKELPDEKVRNSFLVKQEFGKYFTYLW